MAAMNPPNFSEIISGLRKQKKLSLDQLAERTLVSKAMLSQIEKGKVNPTIGVLWKIAEGLNVQLRDLLSNEPGRGIFELKTKENCTVLTSDDRKCEIQILSPPKMIESVELYLLHFLPGGVLASKAHSPHTFEIVTALEGTLEVISGERSSQIKPFESIHYSADLPHTIKCVGPEPARAYLAVRYQ